MLVSCVLMQGCVGTDTEAWNEIKANRSTCTGQTFRTNTERARCYNAAEARLGEVMDGDLANLLWQSRLALAEKVDRKELTKTEARLQFARIDVDITAQVTRRRQDRQLAEAQYEADLAQRRSLQAIQTPITTLGSFACVSRPGSGDVRTECRETAPVVYSTNRALQYQ